MSNAEGSNLISTTLVNRLREPPGPTQTRAWQELVERYSTWLLRVVRRRLDKTNLAEAEDIVQTTLLYAYRRINTFDPFDEKSETARPISGKFAAWLTSICINTVKQHFRTLRRKPAHRGVGGDAASQLLAELPTEQEFEDQLLRIALDNVKESTRPVKWAIYTEYVLRGKAADEVAKQFDCPVSAIYQVKSRLQERINPKESTNVWLTVFDRTQVKHAEQLC